MKTRSAKINKGNASVLLPKVAEKLKGKVLFPQKVEAARQYLSKFKTSA